MAFGAEDPAVPTMHTARLAAFEDELMRGRARLGVGAQFLVGEEEGHDGWLSVDSVGGFELVEVSWG